MKRESPFGRVLTPAASLLLSDAATLPDGFKSTHNFFSLATMFERIVSSNFRRGRQPEIAYSSEIFSAMVTVSTDRPTKEPAASLYDKCATGPPYPRSLDASRIMRMFGELAAGVCILERHARRTGRPSNDLARGALAITQFVRWEAP